MNWRIVLIFPVLVGVTILLINLQIPLRLAFVMSRSQMNQFAQQVLQSNAPATTSPRQVGVFQAQAIKKVADGMQFQTSETCFITGCLDQFGFAYFPGGKLPNSDVLQTAFRDTTSKINHTRIGGNWFWWLKRGKDV
ncbi:hypothetical protein ACQ4M3_16455 [Leptolyngbya sp. AN03gr2]|uniref:hypothetical protein n=1 Tax=unclassified Leptolyngbya TaxID=2650499 RepID=UPI003D323F2A